MNLQEALKQANLIKNPKKENRAKNERKSSNFNFSEYDDSDLYEINNNDNYYNY